MAGNGLVATSPGVPYPLLMQTISEQTPSRAGKGLALTVTGPIGQTNEIPATQDFACTTIARRKLLETIQQKI